MCGWVSNCLWFFKKKFCKLTVTADGHDLTTWGWNCNRHPRVEANQTPSVITIQGLKCVLILFIMLYPPMLVQELSSWHSQGTGSEASRPPDVADAAAVPKTCGQLLWLLALGWTSLEVRGGWDGTDLMRHRMHWWIKGRKKYSIIPPILITQFLGFYPYNCYVLSLFHAHQRHVIVVNRIVSPLHLHEIEFRDSMDGEIVLWFPYVCLLNYQLYIMIIV